MVHPHSEAFFIPPTQCHHRGERGDCTLPFYPIFTHILSIKTRFTPIFLKPPYPITITR